MNFSDITFGHFGDVPPACPVAHQVDLSPISIRCRDGAISALVKAPSEPSETPDSSPGFYLAIGTGDLKSASPPSRAPQCLRAASLGDKKQYLTYHAISYAPAHAAFLAGENKCKANAREKLESSKRKRKQRGASLKTRLLGSWFSITPLQEKRWRVDLGVSSTGRTDDGQGGFRYGPRRWG